jgi:hypothetical protein
MAIDFPHYQSFYTKATTKSKNSIQNFVFEYLAYRFSIRSPWFNKTFATNNTPTSRELTEYTPTIKSMKVEKNTQLLSDMIEDAPSNDIRDAVVELINLWNDYEINEDYEKAHTQHRIQTSYLEQLKLDLLRRLDIFRPSLNYIIVNILLQQIIRCSKTNTKDCITQVQSSMLSEYTDKEKYFPTIKKLEETEIISIARCADTTVVPIPKLWRLEGMRDSTINNISLPQEQQIVFNRDMMPTDSDFVSKDVTGSMDFAIDQLRLLVKSFRTNPRINTIMTLSHTLPDICYCVIDKLRFIEEKRNEKNKESILLQWRKN